MNRTNAIATRDLSEQQQQEIHTALTACYDKAEKYFNRQFVRPHLTFRRSGKNAGTAFLQQNRINLHPLLFKQNQQAFLEEVIPHEVSHLLVWTLFGRVKPHGNEWQSIMIEVFGCEAKTTHSFDIKAVTNTVAYSCDCSEHALSMRRHKSIITGTRYRCRKCNTELSQN
ncbi:SprT family zinc-dependent metalloprotease [Alteromonas sp. P256]|uniref:SprT family zinc-dependent metalloprotease n=1 Tax=Alteromonas sp. P256 TaxID=3117399 RepID=UPI002FE11C2B